ncbi:hypothetical protein CRUP_023044 [Coryphaenoides rupestris]|nr:hypothetical protein CRUP_023044 [Coryphaenoides rupestris]
MLGLGRWLRPEPIRIQIQVPPKQEVKPMTTITFPQQKSLAVAPPHIKVAANGSVGGSQIIHIQPMVNQQGQQFFLQQGPGEAPIQLLLQGPSPVVGSLVPMVQKVAGQTSGTLTLPVHKISAAPTPVTLTAAKAAASPVRLLKTTATVTTSLLKTTPTVTTAILKTVPAATTPLLKSPTNGTKTVAIKCPPKSPAAVAVPTTTTVTVVAAATAGPSSAAAPALPPARPRPPSGGRGRGGGEKKSKSRDKKPLKVLHTRSGRVSRPPKYKAKDYKFIKNQDLAESHPSDSDDYSEMSVEEEGEEGRRDSSAPSSSSSTTAGHKSKSFHNGSEGGPVQGPRSAPGAWQGAGPRKRAGPTYRPPHLRLLWLQVLIGHPGRRGRRGRPPKLGGAKASAELQAERRKDRLQELVEQCEDQEVMEVLLPRLAKALTLWELLLAKVLYHHDHQLVRVGAGRSVVRRGRVKVEKVPNKPHFPDVYREFESLQGQVRKMAQEYICNPQDMNTALEVRNIEVAKSLGIFDEVNKLKVLPGSAPSSANLASKTLATKNVRYMENSKMLPPSKRFKMENSVPVEQNGIETSSTGNSTHLGITTGTNPVETTSTGNTTHLGITTGTNPVETSSTGNTTHLGSRTGTNPVETSSTGNTTHLGSRTGTNPVETSSTGNTTHLGSRTGTNPVETSSTGNTTHLGSRTGTNPVETSSTGGTRVLPSTTTTTTTTTTSSSSSPSLPSLQTPDPTPSTSLTSITSLTTSSTTSLTSITPMEILEDHLSNSLAPDTELEPMETRVEVEPSPRAPDQIVIVEGPDGTTMHIQTPEGVPLEAVQALLGIEASEESRALH